MKKKRRVVIFCGGPSSEHDVSIASAKNIFALLDRKKYQPAILYIDRSLNAELVDGMETKLSSLKEKRPLLDVLRSKKSTRWFGLALLAALHGEFGEDGGVQGLLDYLNIPYTGSGMRASALAMDKYRSALLVKHIPGVAIPNTHMVASEKTVSLPFKFPVILKPNDLGSSVGVAIIRNKRFLNEELRRREKKFPGHQFLLQEYIPDAIEVSCGCLERRDGRFVPLPPIEIIPKKDEFFTYKSKYEPGASDEIVPPRHIAGDVGAHISLLTCAIHTLLGCRTYSRSDFLIKGKRIYYLETNTLPGMTTNSLLPKEAAAVGIPFPKLLDFIIDNSPR